MSAPLCQAGCKSLAMGEGVAGMVSAGVSAEEIRELVHGHELQPNGCKGIQLAEWGLSHGRLKRSHDAVFEGDLDVD